MQLAFAKPYQCEELVAAAPLQAGLDAATSIPLPTPRYTRRGGTSSKTSSKSASSSEGGSNGSSSSSSSGSSEGASTSSSSRGEGSGTRVRSWSAREAWLTPQEFAAELHSPTYAPLLGCDSWRACSTMVGAAASKLAWMLVVWLCAVLCIAQTQCNARVGAGCRVLIELVPRNCLACTCSIQEQCAVTPASMVCALRIGLCPSQR